MLELTEAQQDFGVKGLGREPNKDEDVWLLFEPDTFRAAGIRVVAWMESLKPKEQPKQDENSKDEQADEEFPGSEEQQEAIEAESEQDAGANVIDSNQKTDDSEVGHDHFRDEEDDPEGVDGLLDDSGEDEAALNGELEES